MGLCAAVLDILLVMYYNINVYDSICERVSSGFYREYYTDIIITYFTKKFKH